MLINQYKMNKTKNYKKHIKVWNQNHKNLQYQHIKET